MKEIKYRVWLNGLKNMCEVKSINFDSGIVYVKHEEHHNGYDKSRSEVYDIVGCHAVPVMQYTGVNELNEEHTAYEGKMIYSGDIVRRITDFHDEFVGVVKMMEGCWFIDSGKDAVLLWTESDINIVVGNIYENKDLLND